MHKQINIQSNHKLLLLIFDILIIIISVVSAYLISPKINIEKFPVNDFNIFLLTVLFTYLILYFGFDAYDCNYINKNNITKIVLINTIIIIVFSNLIIYIYEFKFVGRWISISTIIFMSVFKISLQFFYLRLYNKKLILSFIGTDKDVVSFLESNLKENYHFQIVQSDSVNDSLKVYEGFSGDTNLDKNNSLTLKSFILSYLDFIPLNCLIYFEADIIDNITRAQNKYIIRICDIIFSLLIGLITIPLLLSLFVIYHIKYNGKIIYSQKRIGIGNKEFTIYKIRTMQLESESDNPIWAKDNDDRILPIGKFLRKYRIDELPQLYNIIKGEMSFVGPRPERKYFSDKVSEEIPKFYMRNLSKPGLTGWAQIKFHYASSVNDSKRKLEYDLYYLYNDGLHYYFKVLYATIFYFMKGSK